MKTLAIRELGDTSEPWMFPVLDEQSGSVVLEHGDSAPTLFDIGGFRVSRFDGAKWRSVIDLHENRATVLLTDARTVVVCRTFDNGGGFTGFGVAGFAVAVAANSASRARARRRSQGKALVLQMRHPWLSRVGASEKHNWLDEHQLVLDTKAHPREGGDQYRVTMLLDKRHPVHTIARDLARRAASHRLRYPATLDEEARAGFEKLADVSARTDQRNTIAFHVLPSYYFLGRGEAEFASG